jgi:iron-sulfur cluster assembly protein CyaY
MDQDEYLRQADDCLAMVSRWLEDFDPDELDYSMGDGVLTLEFPDGERFILSRQAAAKQVWFAAAAHGWHYNWDPAGQRWVDDKDGHELRSRLAEVVSEKIGRPVDA